MKLFFYPVILGSDCNKGKCSPVGEFEIAPIALVKTTVGCQCTVSGNGL
jgi:hypothetical protein